MVSTVGITTAATIAGLSPSTLAYRARTRRLPVARRRPLRFRVEDVIEYAAAMPLKSPRGRPPGTTDVRRIARDLCEAAAKVNPEFRKRLDAHKEAVGA